MELLGSKIKCNLISVHLEMVLMSVQHRCMVCAKHIIGSEIILDTPDGTVDVSPPIAYHRGPRGIMFGLQRMRNSMVNARDSQFILVRALDRGRVIALRPVGVSLCVGLIVKVLSCIVLCYVV